MQVFEEGGQRNRGPGLWHGSETEGHATEDKLENKCPGDCALYQLYEGEKNIEAMKWKYEEKENKRIKE